jgi:uncharacterized protein with FMN-binding domain
MRRITMWFVGTVVAVVLLFSYRTSTSGAGSAGTAAPPGVVTPAAGATTPATDGTAPAAGGTAAVVVNGSVAQTRWGPVQVQVRIASGKITDVKTLHEPNGNRRDVEINAYAVPRLRAEVLAAQSANIDAVSGATVTSDGYVSSLQAALDSAHFKG